MMKPMLCACTVALSLLTSAAWAGEVEVGKDGMFAMTLPEGYSYDNLNYWYAAPDGKVHVTPRDVSFFTDADYFKEALDAVPGEAKTQPLGKSTLIIKEEKEGFNGPSTLYFIDFNGQFKKNVGCMIRFSNFEGLQGTQSPEVLKAVASVRRYTPFMDFPKSFDKATTAAMSTFMNTGLYAADGNTVFGQVFDSKGNFVFARLDLEAKGSFFDVKSSRIIDKGVQAKYVSLYGDYVFYIRGDKGLWCARKDGSGAKMVIEDAVDYLQVRGDTMYWCNSAYKFMKVDMTTLVSVIEGKTNLEGEAISLQDSIAEVFEKEIYYPFMLDEEWLLYQDDADHESLHLRHLSTGTDIPVTGYPSNGPIAYGSGLYFRAKQGETETLARVDLSAPSIAFNESEDSFACSYPKAEFSGKAVPTQLSIDMEGYGYAGLSQGRHVSQWKDFSNADAKWEDCYCFMGPEFNIFLSYGSNGKVSSIRLASSAGGISTLPRLD
ncbi:MAG: DUF5050 domain-containing protein [Mailhella sp.]|nr:DUF5050 domain-containing protein [Mailhella sp.]